MNRPLKKSWVSGPAVRKLFPDGEHQSIDALTAVWDEVVDRIISEMMTLGEANSVELHINIREDMVMGLVQLQSWLAERVVEKRVTGRDLSSIEALLHDSTAARVGALFQLLVQDTTAQDFGLPSSAIRLRM